MNVQLDQLAVLAQGYIQSGEEIIATANVNYGGKVNHEQPLTGLAALHAGQIGSDEGVDLAARSTDPSAADFPTARSMGLVLTGTRILVWSRGGLKAKYKSFIGDVPLEAIERVTVDEGRLTDHIQIRLGSGWEVNLDANRNEGGAELGAQLLALTTDRRQPGEQWF